MKGFFKWHQDKMFWFMKKLNLGTYEIAWISWVKGIIITILYYELIIN